MVWRRILGATALVVLFAAFPAIAQETVLTNEGDPSADTATPATPQTAWATRCLSEGRHSDLVCTTSQRIRTKDSNQLLGSLTIQIPADGKPLLIVSLPLGLSIQGGVNIDVDGASNDTLPLQTCDRTGCFASAPISTTLLGALQKGSIVNVSFLSLSKQPVKLQFTLTGFDAAYKKIA